MIMRNLTAAQLELLSEGNYRDCPGCGSKDAYHPLRGNPECPEDGCRFFTQKRRDEVKGSPDSSEPYAAFFACEHDPGYFNHDFMCGVPGCGSDRSSVQNDWDSETDDPVIQATVNGKFLRTPMPDEYSIPHDARIPPDDEEVPF